MNKRCIPETLPTPIAEPKVAPEQLCPISRPCVKAKFLFIGEEKFYIRGVTYGTFRPDALGNEYTSRDKVERDFAMMRAHGINSVRTYTVPPPWFLDAALRHGLYVMVGLPWEQHVAFLEDKGRTSSIEERVRAGVRACAGHPAVLCYTIGNEIPASIVRWSGRQRTERFIKRLYQVAKAEDPEGLVTYVNFPTTEYLQLPFLDFFCFNVYLESQDRLQTYLARLQNIAGDRPLVMAEIGLDSRRNGVGVQAHALDWQIRTAFGSGCAGVFAFSWTDEWYRGGHDIEGWDFGLTTRDRRPKPALAAVGRAFQEVPFPRDLAWPRVSVVVCSYNGHRTLGQCLESLRRLDYQDYEVIVVDDGSHQSLSPIANEHSVRFIRVTNGGLSRARNIGLEAATGDIVVYIDDDAFPDPHWLSYLAHTFLTTDYAAVGGPNVAPPGDGQVADCIDNAPGNPTHVLLSDQDAEHLPGCNMAFRKSCLAAIGGFDPFFRIAGDDVDVCWRLSERGWKLGFNPAAMVWHHRRNSVRAFWNQQRNYGRAEALLEKKWPQKYNAAGHFTWAGRVYANGLTIGLGLRPRIYQGTWGSAPFQSLYHSSAGTLESLPLMPEWYLVNIALAAFSALGMVWSPLAYALPFLIVAVCLPLVGVLRSISCARYRSALSHPVSRLQRHALTAFLHILQPLSRLYGRFSFGLTPWRQRGMPGLSLPRPRMLTVWSERWRAPEDWLKLLEADLRQKGAVVLRGGDFDHWDLEVRGGLFGAARLRMAIEEHGAGKQFLRFRSWPRCSLPGVIIVLIFAALSFGAELDHCWAACTLLSGSCLAAAWRTLQECGTAKSRVLRSLRRLEREIHGELRQAATVAARQKTEVKHFTQSA